MEYNNLYVTALTPELHSKTCNYWYVVTNGSMPHTAFRTEQGLKRWLDERGLKLNNLLTPNGPYSSQKIKGNYCRKEHINVVDFVNLQHVLKTKTLSNGNYVLAKITENQEGIRTVHNLNPNVKSRYVFDYFKSEKEMK